MFTGGRPFVRPVSKTKLEFGPVLPLCWLQEPWLCRVHRPASPRLPPTSHRPAPKITEKQANPAEAELAKRIDAANTARNSGDPAAVAAANQRLIALALARARSDCDCCSRRIRRRSNCIAAPWISRTSPTRGSIWPSLNYRPITLMTPLPSPTRRSRPIRTMQGLTPCVGGR